MSRPPILPYVLLAILFVAAHLLPHTQPGHGDDLDNQCGAWLVSEGWMIHRDFFTHHPAVPYWFAAPAVKLLGNQPWTFRATLLVFYALALAALYWTNRHSRFPFSFGLFLLFLALGHVRYWGHLYLADNFYAFGILLVFHQFWRYGRESMLGIGDWILVSLGVFFAFGSTLVAAYPLAILAIGFFVKHLRFGRSLLVSFPVILVIVALPLAAAAGVLWWNGALDDYWNQVFLFNLRYYRVDAGPAIWPPAIAPLGFFLEGLGRALVYLLDALVFKHGAFEFILALANVGVLGTLLGAHRYWSAIFYVVYLLTLMFRMGNFHEAPYIVQSLWAAAWVLRPVGVQMSESWRAFRQGAPAQPATYPDTLRTMAAVVFVFILASEFSRATTLVSPPEPREREVARLCARLTLPDERIAVFPNSPDIYLDSERKPAVPAYYYLPWVDRWEPLRRRMVESIERQEPKLVVINWWYFPVGNLSFRTYGNELRDAIRRNYQPISQTIPRIYARNASYTELQGRYEQVRQKPVVETSGRDLLALPVYAMSSLEQPFDLADRVIGSRLELLLSAGRRSNADAVVTFGRVESDGKNVLLLNERIRAARIRYYPESEKRRYRYTIDLSGLGPLKPSRYFFRIDSDWVDPAEGLQVWTTPATEQAGLAPARYGADTLARTVAFRLEGLTAREPAGVYPLLEQSLDRFERTGTKIDQIVTMPGKTRVSAVAVLLNGEAPQGRPADYRFSLFGQTEKPIAWQRFTAEKTGRAWKVFSFAPIYLRESERIRFQLMNASNETTHSLHVWTSGSDLLRSGSLSIDGRTMPGDLCFRIYETAPPKTGLPDIALSGLDFAPADPVPVSPPALVNLSLNVENRGTTDTGPFWIEFYATSQDFSRPRDFVADSLRIQNVAPGDRRALEIDRALYTLPDGRYSIEAIADRPAEVFELDETNNQTEAGAKTLLVVARTRPVNLFVDEFSIREWQLVRGGPIDFRGHISNSGREDSGRFTIAFWAAREPKDPDTRLRLCEPIVVDSLAPNGVVDLADYTRTIGDLVPTGRVFIGCTVDPLNAVAETSENDNTAWVGPATIGM